MENDKVKIIEQIFNLMGTPAESVVYSLDEKRGHVFTVKSIEFEKISVGRDDLAKDLLYLIKRIFNKSAVSGAEIYKCTIDINDLQSEADARIIAKAQEAATEARNLKTDILMEPMSSYERMVVHSALTGNTDISTESVGEGKERRIKIKYLPI
jgi:spoIIIJ-associated protein